MTRRPSACISGVKWTRCCEPVGNFEDIFSIVQQISEGLVQLVVLAMELLIVTSIVGVVDALTAHEVPEALDGLACASAECLADG